MAGQQIHEIGSGSDRNRRERVSEFETFKSALSKAALPTGVVQRMDEGNADSLAGADDTREPVP
jgi:hypothetical protein